MKRGERPLIHVQKSYEQTDTGTLFVVPTPIGNLEDMTYRGVRTLQEVSAIAAEDTRNTKKLLAHFDIHTPLFSYHEHSTETREQECVVRLKRGEDIALVSDAGMPAVSDPGQRLVQAAIDEEISVVVLPGANAALCSLVGSGLPTDTFLFYGFLPRKKKEKEHVLTQLFSRSETVIVYESPFRVKETIQAIAQFGEERQIAIARELTKKFEEYIRGSAKDVLQYVSENPLKGECCIVIEGIDDNEATDELWWSHLSVVEHVNYYINEQDMRSKDAIGQVSTDRKLQKRMVYEAYHIK